MEELTLLEDIGKVGDFNRLFFQGFDALRLLSKDLEAVSRCEFLCLLSEACSNFLEDRHFPSDDHFVNHLGKYVRAVSPFREDLIDYEHTVGHLKSYE